IGNVWEWTSDQVSCNGTTCTGVDQTANTADSTNDDFDGVAFDGNQGPNASGTFTSFGKIQIPIGIPIAGGYTGDVILSLTSTQFHGDFFWINVAAAVRGAMVGGNWNSTSLSGRYSIRF